MSSVFTAVSRAVGCCCLIQKAARHQVLCAHWPLMLVSKEMPRTCTRCHHDTPARSNPCRGVPSQRQFCRYTPVYIFPPMARQHYWARASSLSRLYDHTHYTTHLVGFLWKRDRPFPKTSTWHHTTHSVELRWTSDQPDAQTSSLQHTTPTRDRHPYPGGILTLSPSKQAAADPSFRTRGHRDRPRYPAPKLDLEVQSLFFND